ncbi:MAG: hypothetical protein ACKVP0_08460 [Pirellulaceae bacterium]
MSAADKPVENATPPSDSPPAQHANDSTGPAKPRRLWRLVALVVGLLILSGQIYLQRDYWGLVLNQGTFFPNLQRASFIGSRESKEPRRHLALPIPGSPESLAGTVPTPKPNGTNLEGNVELPDVGGVKAKP